MQRKDSKLQVVLSYDWYLYLLYKCTNCSKSLGIHGGAVCTQGSSISKRWAPGPFLPLFIAKFWSRYNTSIPTPNQSSSPLWIAASTPDTVPAIPCPLVKRLQPLHQSLCNVWSPPDFSAKLVTQRWFSVQDFCVGLADPSVRELSSSGAKLWLGVVGAYVELCRSGKLPAPHRSQYFVQLKTFGAVGGTISGGRAYTAVP